MGGTAVDQGSVTIPGGGIVGAVRVASKPAFAILVGAIAFLAQDIFQRITHVVISNDEAIAFVTVLSWLAYWLIPASLQDGGVQVVSGPPAPAA
jgi:hypothetical protein